MHIVAIILIALIVLFIVIVPLTVRLDPTPKKHQDRLESVKLYPPGPYLKMK